MKTIRLNTGDSGDNKPSRRQFLRAAAAGAAAVGAPAFLRGRDLNNKLNIAIIGAGGRGAENTKDVASENIVALCDVLGE